MTQGPEAAERARRAEALLREEGMSAARVDPEGPEAEIAAVRVPSDARERWFGPDGAALAARLRALGFRYVALDLAPAPPE